MSFACTVENMGQPESKRRPDLLLTDSDIGNVGARSADQCRHRRVDCGDRLGLVHARPAHRGEHLRHGILLAGLALALLYVGLDVARVSRHQQFIITHLTVKVVDCATHIHRVARPMHRNAVAQLRLE